MVDRAYPGTAPVGATSVKTTTMLSGGVHTHRRISWAAIFGGVILVVVVQLLLSTLGAGIGLGTVNVNAGTTPDAGNFGIGAGIWWVISSCIALFVAVMLLPGSPVLRSALMACCMGSSRGASQPC